MSFRYSIRVSRSTIVLRKTGSAPWLNAFAPLQSQRIYNNLWAVFRGHPHYLEPGVLLVQLLQNFQQPSVQLGASGIQATFPLPLSPYKQATYESHRQTALGPQFCLLIARPVRFSSRDYHFAMIPQLRFKEDKNHP